MPIILGMIVKPKRTVFCALLILFVLGSSQPAYAGGENLTLIFSGLARTVFSVVKLPVTILAGSTKAFPLGLISGVFQGTAQAIGGTLAGVFDTARGAAPYAKYAIFAL